MKKRPPVRIVAMTKKARTMVGSIWKYSAMPPQTPDHMRFVALRTRRSGMRAFLRRRGQEECEQEVDEHEHPTGEQGRQQEDAADETGGEHVVVRDPAADAGEDAVRIAALKTLGHAVPSLRYDVRSRSRARRTRG